MAAVDVPDLCTDKDTDAPPCPTFVTEPMSASVLGDATAGGDTGGVGATGATGVTMGATGDTGATTATGATMATGATDVVVAVVVAGTATAVVLVDAADTEGGVTEAAVVLVVAAAVEVSVPEEPSPQPAMVSMQLNIVGNKRERKP